MGAEGQGELERKDEGRRAKDEVALLKTSQSGVGCPGMSVAKARKFGTLGHRCAMAQAPEQKDPAAIMVVETAGR